MSERGRMEAALERLLADERLSRRRFLGRGASAGLMASTLATALSACGSIEGTQHRRQRELEAAAEQIHHPRVPIEDWTFSNWPLYIDKAVLKTFDARYGGRVKYVEDISDNYQFFGKVRQQLMHGAPIGRDLVVLASYMTARWISSGYTEPIDKRNVPNMRNLVAGQREPVFDPKRQYSLPWQSYATGLAYNLDVTGRELRSLEELFSPEWKGRVTVLSDWHDSAGLTLLLDGRDPTTAPVDDYLAAIEKLGEANAAGQFRRFTGNDYTTDLAKGNIAIAMAYSGDVVQLQSDNPKLRFVYPEEGGLLASDNMMIPAKASHPYAAETMMNFVYEPEIAAKICAWVNYISPVEGVKEILAKDSPEARRRPVDLPGRADAQAAARVRVAERRGRAGGEPRDGEGDGRMSVLSLRRRRGTMPWLFMAPALLWLAIFFAIPLVNQLNVSLMSGNADAGFTSTWAFHTYTDAIRDYHVQFLRSLQYAGIATVVDLAIAFPLAYFIAFKAGRWRSVMLLLVVLPFFVSYVLRTVSWQLILADNGWVADRLRDIGLLSANGRLLATSTAVIAGIAYNFLPFMVLPLYVSLERMDRRLIEAATDLYASRATAFRKVTLPLAIPGIFAGSLLCFIPAVGDYVNAALLGTSRQYMIGNVVQSKYLDVLDYPTAAAMSFILLLLIVVGIAVYGRLLGTRNLMDAAV